MAAAARKNPSTRAAHIPFRVQPMLATLVAEPFDKPGWTYEEKYDGDRILAYKEGTRVTLLSRNGKDRNERFPHVVAAIAKLRPATLLLDGEMVVFDSHRISRFQLLQQGEGKPVYAVFDCLYCDGRDLRKEPLTARRAVLEPVLNKDKSLLLGHRLAKNGIEAFRQAKRKGYEGLVAKKLSSRYVEARSPEWLKVKVHREDEFVIAGFTPPGGSRKYFGALLLGAYEKGKLRFVGKVGTGFDQKRLAALYKTFQPLARKASALSDPPREKGVTWLEPKLVAQISYQELTADKKLRQPVFLGLRDDKKAKDVTIPVARKA